MFLDYYSFIEQPFGVTPDPRFLHLGPKHREALASLIYGSEMNRGFLALVALPGMGKTSLLFHFLEGLRNKARTAFLFHTARDPQDLMRYLLADIGLDASGKDLPEMHEMLNEVLTEEMRAGQRFVLVIDEAQNLNEKVLESVRLLSNFETPWAKLLQIVLSGQPQLGECLARPSMRQLRQRVSSFIRLEPFTPEETSTYIDHRLWVAGYEGPQLFSASARKMIAEHSGGIPRNINNLCFQSLSIACATSKRQVDSTVVREAISDLAVETFFFESGQRLIISSDRDQADSRRLPLAPEPSAQPGILSRRPTRMTAAVVSSVAVLFLGFVSGALWKTAAPPDRFDVTPSVEAAAFPAPPRLARAPETIPTREAPPQAEVSGHDGLSSQPGTARESLGTRILTVRVEPGVTLRHLCLLYLDRFDAPTFAEIRALNPAVTDPNHIDAGQQLRLPLYLRRGITGGSTEVELPPNLREESP